MTINFFLNKLFFHITSHNEERDCIPVITTQLSILVNKPGIFMKTNKILSNGIVLIKALVHQQSQMTVCLSKLLKKLTHYYIQ